MDHSIAAQFRHRLVSYALVATLSVCATIAPSVSEAGSAEERRETAAKSDPTIHDHRGTMVHWFAAAKDEADAESSFFQRWLADIYNKLLGLKAAIKSTLPHAWKWAQGKSDNTCR